MDNEFNYSTDDILNLLTVAMHVDHADGDSNWVKYFKSWKDTFTDIQAKNNAIRQANDLDYCYGAMLDDEARNVGISRNGVDDDFLRFEIKSRLLARLCDGSMPAIYQLVANALGCKPTEFSVQPMYAVDGTPNAVQINDIPDMYLGDSRKAELLRDVIQEAVADGIRVVAITYQSKVYGQEYVGGYAQIETESTVGLNRRGTAYVVDNYEYLGGATQIETEITVPFNRRIPLISENIPVNNYVGTDMNLDRNIDI